MAGKEPTPGILPSVVAQLTGTMAKNLAYLYGLQFVGYIWPLVTIPYLTRVLGPVGWGKVAMFQAFGIVIASVVDYSFSLSGTREVARRASLGMSQDDLASSVVGSKALLALTVLVGAFGAVHFIPVAHRHASWVVLATVYGVAFGLNFNWFFRGRERMATYAALDASTKGLGVLAILLFVRTPSQAQLVLLIWAISAGVAFVAGGLLVTRDVTWRSPDWREIQNQLSSGWSMFVLTAAMGSYAMANTFFIGIVATPAIAGFYAGAERIVRAAMRMLQPINIALLPRLTSELARGKKQAKATRRKSMMASYIIALVLGALLYIAAPIIVNGFLGKDFQASVPTLRVFALLPLVSVPINVLGLQWLLSIGKETALGRITLIAGAANLVAVVSFAALWGAVGGAAALVSAELLLAALIIAYATSLDFGSS